MYTFFSIVLIIAFAGIILIALTTGISTHQQLSQYSQDILDETLFYLKSNPSITCSITQVQRIAWEEPSVTLSVIYPDKSIEELSFTLKEFKKSWIEL